VEKQKNLFMLPASIVNCSR